MDVLHVVPGVTATSIPIEIASALDGLSDVESRVVSEASLPEDLPDIIDDDQIVAEWCGFESYGAAMSRFAGEFDIVHTHHVRPGAKVGYHALGTSMTHVNGQYGHIHYTLDERLRNLPSLLLADHIIYCSKATAGSYNALERLVKHRATEHVVHFGVNIDIVEPFRATIDEPTTVVTAARLIPRKNLSVLVRALDHVDGLTLRIIGDGPHRDALEAETRATGVSSRVEFVGHLERRAVYRELADADVFALPSHGEGFCLAVAEAMAVGLPVVVSDIPTFHEVVGSSGVYVDRTDPKALAAALANLRDDPTDARRRGEQNRARIFDQFTLERCVREYRDIYRATL
jgi:glycosyltransferase involved in cell wall biosynthesis